MLGYMLAVGISSAAIYSILEDISKNSGLHLATLNQGTGYMVRENFLFPCYTRQCNVPNPWSPVCRFRKAFKPLLSLYQSELMLSILWCTGSCVRMEMSLLAAAGTAV